MPTEQLCGANKKNCPCGYRYQTTDPKGPQAVCPTCSKPRACCKKKVPGTERCSIHGGKSLTGPANPAFTHGNRAVKDWMPKNLIGFVEELANDEDLLNGLDELRVLAARFRLLWARNEGINVFEAIKTAWYAFEAAMKLPDSDPDKQEYTQKALGDLNKLIKTGGKEGERFREIYSLASQLANLRETERRRLYDETNALTPDKALFLVNSLYTSITKHVKAKTDAVTARAILAGVADDLRTLLPRSSPIQIAG